MSELATDGLAPHPYAGLFPLIEGAAFDELTADILASGLRQPIVLLDGQVLDGRNRYRAAVAAGLFPARPDRRALKLWFRDYERDLEGDPLAFVLSHNLHRRHLSESQRALVAARLATLGHGGDRRSRGASEPAQAAPPERDQAADLPLDPAPAPVPAATLTQAQAAEALHVSERSVRAARSVVAHGAPELVARVERGEVSVSAAAGLSRLSVLDQQAAIRSADPGALYRVIKEKRAADQAAKKARRAEREAALGDRIKAGEGALAGLATEGRRFGVILADPEWRFEPWSAATGMDRAADNHYPTSTRETIAARPVGAIAADDCVLLLWATAPMLPDALAVMAGWGFAYRSHAIWRKDRIGTGYWFRNQHELLLVGTRGAPPAPAMGEQPASVFDAAAAGHSEKPDFAHAFAERHWPTLPKIELNARTARPGWEVWGAEAPEGDGVSGPSSSWSGSSRPSTSSPVEGEAQDVDARHEGEHDGEDAAGDDPDADDGDAPPAKAPRRKAAREPDWRREQAAREDRVRTAAGGLCDDLEALTAAYRGALEAHDRAVNAEDAAAAGRAQEAMDAAILRANGGSAMGTSVAARPAAIRRACWAPVGAVPLWGQTGQFALEHRDVLAIVSLGDAGGALHAMAFNRPFPSETGFHSIQPRREPGMSVVDLGRAMIEAALAYSPGGRGKPAAPLLPGRVYRLERDAHGRPVSLERGAPLDAGAAGLDLADLESVLARWDEEERARRMDGRKGKRSFPESLHGNSKIIAVDGRMLTPAAEFPTQGAYVVGGMVWRAGDRDWTWRYVADAAAQDDGLAAALAAGGGA